MGAARDKQVVIRATQRERDLWERLASERGLNVSDLSRRAVSAYTQGEVGIPFARTCAIRRRHTPGRTCPGCGGNTRQAA
jgi:hypothetical protein